MKTESFTTVGMCLCGCDESFVDNVAAINAEEAAEKTLERRKRPGKVFAVFQGALKDNLEHEVIKS